MVLLRIKVKFLFKFGIKIGYAMELMKKISGYISFLIAVGMLTTSIFAPIADNLRERSTVPGIIGLLIFSPMLYFVYKSKFWEPSTSSKPILKLDTDLEVLKKEIEKEELLKKLSALEKELNKQPPTLNG